MRTIGPAFTPEETQAFVAGCLSHVGKPFRHMGRGPSSFDCAGLALYELARLGRPIFDLDAYGREPFRDGLREAIRTNLGDSLPAAQNRAGDVVLMRFDGEPRHVGVLGDHPQGGLMLIHTYSRVRKVVAHRLDERWASYIIEAYRP